jgi:hypothetical protein
MKKVIMLIMLISGAVYGDDLFHTGTCPRSGGCSSSFRLAPAHDLPSMIQPRLNSGGNVCQNASSEASHCPLCVIYGGVAENIPDMEAAIAQIKNIPNWGNYSYLNGAVSNLETAINYAKRGKALK